MDVKGDIAFQRAYNLKMHQRKLEEIKKTPTKRLDNQLPLKFLNKKNRIGYKNLWWAYKINRENEKLLERIISIKQKKSNEGKTDKESEKSMAEVINNRDEVSLADVHNTSALSYQSIPKKIRRLANLTPTNMNGNSLFSKRIDKIKLEPLKQNAE